MGQRDREDAVGSWIKRVAGVPFVWCNQNAPVPEGDFVSGKVISFSTPGVRPQEDNADQIRYHGEFAVVVTIYAENHFDIYEKIRYSRDRTELDTVNVILAESPSPVKDVPFIYGKTWEPAGTATLRFRFVEVIESASQTIESVSAEGIADSVLIEISVP